MKKYNNTLNLADSQFHILQFNYNCTIENVFFLDIETTGLSAAHDYIYLIGTLHFENGTWHSIQRFAHNPDEEIEILQDFIIFQKKLTHTIDYNGKNFDWKFLTEKQKQHNLEEFSTHKEIDCYQELKPLKQLLNLPNLKQGTLEEFLSYQRSGDISGKKCIRVYRDFVAFHREEDRQQLLKHNFYDLTALSLVLSLLSYGQLYQGAYEITEAAYNNHQEPEITLRLPIALPVDFSFSNSYLSLLGRKSIVKLTLKPENGYLYNFYKNYKDYYYLPIEDTAIHKSVGAYVSRNYRKQATAKNCYTRFQLSPSFITDHQQLESYIQNNLSFLIEKE